MINVTKKSREQDSNMSLPVKRRWGLYLKQAIFLLLERWGGDLTILYTGKKFMFSPVK